MNTKENPIFTEFPKSVLEQANAASGIRASSYSSNRLDLRGKSILAFTETPEMPTECAYSLYRVGSGWQLGIHVADVCEYVCDGSPLDIEARKRLATVQSGTSYSNMLPDKITNDVCNLTQQGDRLAISLLLSIDNDGNVTSMEFEESVIRTAGICIYSEIDELQLAADASSVLLLREKYAPYKNILDDMYELAANFCMRRVSRRGLDCIYFRRVYERDSQGKITAFRRVSEPDSRAMIREIGYFTAEAVGRYMLEHKLPCVFNGRDAVATDTLNYLSNLVGADNSVTDPAIRSANIADLAKGSQYYDFVCDALAANVPCATFSTEPITNSFCASDHIVSFFHPVSRYADLLIQRIVKTAIVAKDPMNLNLNRQRKIVCDVASDANRAEQFVDKVRRDYASASALEYMKNNIDSEFTGFPVHTNSDGSVLVLMECGVKATVPAEYAQKYEYTPAHPAIFKIVEINDSAFVKPVM